MSDFYNSISIIIVVYKAALEDTESFQSVRQMCRQGFELDLFIYDNSPGTQEISEYPGLKITYRHDPLNSGVSKAYNQGADHARALNHQWVLLLDQDTVLPPNIIDEYENAIGQNPEIKMVVPILKLINGRIFSPCTYSFKRGFYLNSITPGLHSLYSLSPVNSGMLVNVSAFLEVGGYNNAVKLDFSDFQFVERFRKRHPNFLVMDSVCVQDFSDEEGSYSSQAIRFKYYCDGARNIEKSGIWDWLQYNMVVLLRVIRLCWRHKNFAFITTYFTGFLGSNSEIS